VTAFTKSIVEDAALAWLEIVSWHIWSAAERSEPNYRDVVSFYWGNQG